LNRLALAAKLRRSCMGHRRKQEGWRGSYLDGSGLRGVVEAGVEVVGFGICGWAWVRRGGWFQGFVEPLGRSSCHQVVGKAVGGADAVEVRRFVVLDTNLPGCKVQSRPQSLC
jgi:hypothetical protein